ncbi:hypothetical protein J6W91_00215 [Candidatus Saccharibacteria bacterium]|nr:hypothetical protein [Candidatus Saccharibacteria bacterium]
MIARSNLRLPTGSTTRRLAGSGLSGKIISKDGLVELIDRLFSMLTREEALDIWIYQAYILVGIREKGHSEYFYEKFINYGLVMNNNSRNESLSSAIRDVDGGSLKKECYDAINGDIDALKETTKHLINTCRRKLRRAYEKRYNASMSMDTDERAVLRVAELNEIILDIREHLQRSKEALTAATSGNITEFLELSEPVIIEIPKDYYYFYDKDPNEILDEDEDFIFDDPIDNEDYEYVPET